MAKRVIVIFPEFEQIRGRLDPLSSAVKTHITLVPPFESEITTGELRDHIAQATAPIHPFHLVLQGITGHEGEYVFLNIKRGNDRLIELRDQLYTGPLQIALLAAILFPVFSRAMESARHASNLKQIGLGMMQYTQDYDERMPSQQYGFGNQGQDVDNFASGDLGINGTASSAGRNWILMMQPYVKSREVFRCPSTTPYPASGTGIFTGYEPVGDSDTSYVANGASLATFSGATIEPRSLASIPEASALIWVHERKERIGNALVRPYLNGSGTGTGDFVEGMYDAITFYYSPSGYLGGHHFDGSSLLYVDGHVKWQKQSKICDADFGISGTDCGDKHSTGAGAPLF